MRWLILATALMGCGSHGLDAGAADLGGNGSSDLGVVDDLGAVGGDGGTVLPSGSVGGATAVACPNGAAAGATCTRVTVSCPGVEDVQATVAVATPASPTGATVLLHDGGGGTALFNHANVPALLLQKNLRVVQVAWASAWEVSATAKSALVAACRPATLLRWVFANAHSGSRSAGFCALGHSGGSGVLAYVLSHYGLGDTLDFAMLSAGPPFGRIDVGCAPSTYTGGAITECPGAPVPIANAPISYDPGFAGPFLNMIEGTTTCLGTPSAADVAHWAADSVVSPGASYDYPQTPVSAWYCGNKPNETTGLGYLYHSQITSAKDVHCVGGACSGEDVYADAPTVTAMVQALAAGCVPHH
jgi:hypothetical protein